MHLSSEDCADVFQTTFLALYGSLDRIEEPETLAKWIAVTASREALKLKRLKSPTLLEDIRSLDEIVDSETEDAERIAVKECQSNILWQAIDSMERRCRELLKMLYASSEHSYEEISQKTKIPIGGIGPTRSRCLAKLRSILEPRGFFM